MSEKLQIVEGARVETELIHLSLESSIFGLLKDKAEIKGDIIEALDENWSCEK
jgi:hypothetical protein